MVGVLQLGMGLFRLGFLVNFLAHPVISGFTSAAALIIGFSQLDSLLGVDIPRSHHVHTIVLAAISKAGAIDPTTLFIGTLSIAGLLFLKRWKPAFPRALAVVTLGTVSVWGLGLHEDGVAIVGDVPAGFPTPRLPTVTASALTDLMPIALTIALVGFMESIAVAKAFARRRHYEIDANQELVGLGMANLVGSLLSAYPVAGGFGRTAVNAQAGARTGLAALITAAVIAVTLLFLTPLFYFLPKAVLAAIIMTAVFGLIDVAEVRHLWHVKRSDLGFLAVTFGATLTLGIEEGILVGVGTSLAAFIVRSTRPHLAVLGRVSDGIYRNLKRYPEAETFPGLLLVRLDAQFYFGNVNFLKESLRRLESDQEEPIRSVVLEASGINQLDSSGETALREIFDDFARRGIELYFANVKGPVRDVLRRARFYEHVGHERFFYRVEDAVDSLLEQAHDRAEGEASEPPRRASKSGAPAASVIEGPRPVRSEHM
jgi:SulP family sulfate permease